QNIELLEAYLVPQGYEIVKAASGEEALEKLSSNQIELILMDVLMPGTDGFEVTRRIRRDTAYRLIPIILITVLQETEDRVKGIEAGCDDFLSRPVDKMELFARVRSLLKVKAYNDLMRDYQIELEATVTNRTEELRHALEKMEQEITERKRVEDVLRESSARIQALTDSVQDAIIMMGPEGEISYWNPMAESIFGYTANEVMGQNLHNLLAPERYHETYAKNFPAFQKTGQGNAVGQTIELLALGKSSKEIPVSLSLSSVLLHNKWHGVGIIRDITEQKRAEEEREKLQAQFIQAQKMESVGRLAGGVAHDYNNMLSVIMMYAEMGLTKTSPDDELHKYMKTILDAACRSTDITRQLLVFARKQTVLPRILDLNVVIAAILKLLHRLIGEDITLSWHPEPDLWPVKIDPSQVDQVLANLLVNARDAITGTGEITIETGRITYEAAFCAAHPRLSPGEFVVLSVTDDGSGMDPQTVDQIFEPFFTTKAEEKGTGLGLATVYGIIIQNNGFVTVDSEPGKGTCFKLHLPRHPEEIEQVPGEDAGAIPQGDGETVLIVEDEQPVLVMVTTVLKTLGYHVLEAPTPKQALTIAGEYPQKIHLMLTDVVMPEMNGRELAEKMRFIRPDTSVLYMSGHAANVVSISGVVAEETAFINKPFAIRDLAKKVREILDKALD
ncbi:MAG: response regulator, partial [Desulfobacteraceae bacterium]|nr:response regulator [Desulfobacteraceae bacterium]